MKETDGSYEALKTFFGILLRRYEKQDVDDFIGSEGFNADKIQSFLDKWIKEGLSGYNEEVEYEECKSLFVDSMKGYKDAEKIFGWYWLGYGPTFN